MPDTQFFIDLHCHPQYKPFARAHESTGKLPKTQSDSPGNRSSLWHYDPPSLPDKLLNYFLSLTKFSQMNLTAALYGRVWVISVTLGCVEKYFFKNKLGTGFLTDLVDDFAAEFGRPRINAIEAMKDYWADFNRELQFVLDQENNPVRIDGHWYTYRVPKNFSELQQNIEWNEADGAGNSKTNPIILSLLTSVEGLHILNCGLEKACNPAEVKKNAKELKKLPNAPLFTTISHHFYNELCGHARSLRQEIGKLTNQEEGIGTGFTPLGREVLDILLDTNGGRQIFIDIKHMSPQSRKEYLQIWKEKYKGKVPIIMSHGVSNGLPYHGAVVSDYPELGNKFINPLEDVKGGDGKFKDHNEINFYDDEILTMVESDGILGLQLDERRLVNLETLKNVKHSFWRNKIMHYRSELLWYQVQYIAELLDSNGLYAWGNIAIGSDYDGLVDPMNAFWTAEEFDDLAGYLERHAYNYFKDHSSRLHSPQNIIKSDEVVQKIFTDNAWRFLQRWF